MPIIESITLTSEPIHLSSIFLLPLSLHVLLFFYFCFSFITNFCTTFLSLNIIFLKQKKKKSFPLETIYSKNVKLIFRRADNRINRLWSTDLSISPAYFSLRFNFLRGGMYIYFDIVPFFFFLFPSFSTNLFRREARVFWNDTRRNRYCSLKKKERDSILNR